MEYMSIMDIKSKRPIVVDSTESVKDRTMEIITYACFASKKREIQE